MAGKGRRVVVEFLGEDKNLSATARKVEGTTGRLGGRMAKVGALAGGLFAGGVVAAGAAMVTMTKNAAEDEASQRKLALALKNTAGATKAQTADVEKWISAQGTALGITDDELRPSFQRLVQATGDVGKAQKLAAIAMDASAGSGKSLETVSTAIAKAQNGNMGALSRLGIKIKDADGKTLSFNEAMKEMSKTFGGQAAAKADSFEGRMDRLKLVFDETKEAIGARLIPIATKLAAWFLDSGLPAIEKFSKFMGAKFGPVIDKVRGFFKKFGADGQATSGKFAKMLSQIRGILGSLSSTVKSVVSIVSSLWKRFGSTIVSFAVNSFKNVVAVISGAFKVIAGIFKVIASVLKGDWKGAWDGIKMIVSGAWQIIKAVVSQGWNVLKSLFSIGASAVKGLFVGLWNALKAAVSAAWNGIKSLVSAGWNAIKTAFSSAGSAIRTTFTNMWVGLKTTVTTKIGEIVDGIRAIPGKILALGSKMKSAGADLMRKFLDGIANSAGFVADFAKGVWTAVKRLINSGIDKINAALEFTIPMPGAIPDVPVNVKNIPHLYKGGIVRGSRYGTPIVAGDRNRAEAIVPLSGPHARGMGGGTTIINVYGVLTEDEAGKKIEQVLTRRVRTTGRTLEFAR